MRKPPRSVSGRQKRLRAAARARQRSKVRVWTEGLLRKCLLDTFLNAKPKNRRSRSRPRKRASRRMAA